MATDLYGESYTDNWDYARKIVTLGAKLPFYKVESSLTSNGCTMTFLTEGNNFSHPKYSEIDCPGLYAIYEKTDKGFSCIYTGASTSSMRHRVYRFIKELYDISRPDENHPGGKKARRAGINPDTLYVKFFPQYEFPNLQNVRINLNTIDETVAILLKSRFNVRKKA